MKFSQAVKSIWHIDNPTVPSALLLARSPTCMPTLTWNWVGNIYSITIFLGAAAYTIYMALQVALPLR